MPRFQIARKQFGTYPILTLRDTKNGAEADIALFGATLLAYRVPVRGKLFDVTDGFQTPEELESGKGGRAWIMAPFSNRIDEGRYTFGGATHAIPMPDPAKRVVLHGFVRQTVFDVVKESADEARAEIVLSTSVIRPGACEGYPFAVDVTVTFTLGDGKLNVQLAGKNVGTTAAPFAGGWHPYFRTGTNGIDKLRLMIPARGRIVTGDRLLPVAGEQAFATCESAPELDFRPHRPNNGNVLGARVLDGAYYNLIADEDGLARTMIEDPEAGIRITVCQEGGLMHVFTGDTLPTRKRASIALEPVMFMTNAFNRPECAADLALAAGATRVFRFGTKVQVF